MRHPKSLVLLDDLGVGSIQWEKHERSGHGRVHRSVGAFAVQHVELGKKFLDEGTLVELQPAIWSVPYDFHSGDHGRVDGLREFELCGKRFFHLLESVRISHSCDVVNMNSSEGSSRLWVIG